MPGMMDGMGGYFGGMPFNKNKQMDGGSQGRMAGPAPNKMLGAGGGLAPMPQIQQMMGNQGQPSFGSEVHPGLLQMLQQRLGGGPPFGGSPFQRQMPMRPFMPFPQNPRPLVPQGMGQNPMMNGRWY